MKRPECTVPRLAIHLIALTSCCKSHITVGHKVAFIRAVDILLSLYRNVGIFRRMLAVFHHYVFYLVVLHLYAEQAMVIEDVHTCLIHILLIDAQRHLWLESELHGVGAIILTNTTIEVVRVAFHDVGVANIRSSQATCGKSANTIRWFHQQHRLTSLTCCIGSHHT